LRVKKKLEIADYVFCPHKKISSRTIRNGGALIVKKPNLRIRGEDVIKIF
jgi:hypothetical protein